MTRTLTVNYLGNMAIRAAMSVSERLSVIWSLGTCRRIQSTDNLLKASRLLSAQLCPLPHHSVSLIIHLHMFFLVAFYTSSFPPLFFLLQNYMYWFIHIKKEPDF